MRPAAVIALLCPLLAVVAPAALEPDAVAVLYNVDIPESRRLATAYREARGIPAANLVPLALPDSRDISRAEYEERIAAPLRAEFDRRGWWKRAKGRDGVTVPTVNRIRVLAVMRGVPLRILPTPQPPPPPPGANAAEKPAPKPPQNPFAGRDDASVDSELAMFGVEGVPTEGGLQNKYFQADRSISGAEFPFLVLTARIDAPTVDTCERMIRDALEAERTGLWGMAYVDIANKYPQGDQWLETVVRENLRTGIPTVVDRFNETLPKNYPMTEAAFYHGWYDWSVSGPFLNPRFKFRKGAVAMHLHSFSAEQLADPAKNWCAPLLERGAAVTVGNVFEPYLHLTHDFGILHRRLLDGHTWVEACWMAMPVASWQGVVLGDPLYRPFKHLGGTGEVRDEDTDFRALRAAMLRWPRDDDERMMQLEKAAGRTRSGIMAEAVGLELVQRDRGAEAVARFQTARALHPQTEDKLRQDFHLIALDRSAGRKDLAIRGLRDAQARYTVIPEAESLKGWLDILDPPPPPPPPPAGAVKAAQPAAPAQTP